MDQADEPSPFAAFTTQTSKLQQQYQAFLDRSTPYVFYRWSATGGLLLLFFLRILIMQGWYIVAYALGIYLLNLFLAFLQPKFDPNNEAADMEMEDGAAGKLPTTHDEEFRPFIRRLPEFKFWYWVSRAVLIALTATFFRLFDVPVFWPVLVMYWLILLVLTMRKQVQHMVKHRYVPFSIGKRTYNKRAI